MPPSIRGVTFSEARARLYAVGWIDDGQRGSHHFWTHPNFPGVRLGLPDHGSRDLAAGILGDVVQRAGLTRTQFLSLTGAGHRRNARRIRREVYGMAG